jgi:hypothetical protein
MRGKPFVKGQIANPRGAKAHDPIKRAVKNASMREIESLFNEVLFADPKDLQKITQTEPTTIKTNVVSALLSDIKKGEVKTLMHLLERIHGRVKEKIELSGPDGSAIQVMTYLPDNGRDVK